MGSCQSSVLQAANPRHASLARSEKQTAGTSPVVDSKGSPEFEIKAQQNLDKDARHIAQTTTCVAVPQPIGEREVVKSHKTFFIYQKDSLKMKVPKLDSIESSSILWKRRALLEEKNLKTLAAKP